MGIDEAAAINALKQSNNDEPWQPKDTGTSKLKCDSIRLCYATPAKPCDPNCTLRIHDSDSAVAMEIAGRCSRYVALVLPLCSLEGSVHDSKLTI